MEIIFEYIKPIVFFLVLETLIFNLISDMAFKKLTKLFCGMVMVLLILAPVEKLMGVTEEPGALLKNAQLEQSIRQCEDMINYGDKYLIGKYSAEYEKIIEEDIRQMTENEGMSLAECDISIEAEEEIKIKKIVLSIAGKEEKKETEDKIDIDTNINIYTKEGIRKISEEPEIIKIKNEIINHYQVNEEDILIRRVK